MKNPFSKKNPSQQEAFLRTYLDRIAPGGVKFEVDHYIFGSTYRCVWALREYPASTEAQALLRELGEKSGVTLRIYCRQVSPGEEDRIIDNANKKNKLDGSDPNKLRQAVAAESNLRDVAELVHKMHREHEPLVHCAVYLEMTADSKERLRQLQTDILTELVRCKLNVDKLLLRQKQGFCCVSPVGSNMLGREFERVLPASSVANLYPFNYSGKTDPNGFYIGKDKYGSNIVVDFDRRDSDKTSANILILGNSGQGKSYLIKLLICNLLEAGKAVIALDAEHELEELCENLGGCFMPDLFIKMFAGGRPITAEEYNALTAVRMENTGKVRGVFDVNFDKREFSAVHIMDGWQTWAMRDVSVAVYHATRSQFASGDDKWRKLLDHLNGKEITSAGHLSARNFSFGEEIIESDGKLNFYLQADFDVDAAFGTFVCTDQNDDWLNIYANYDVERDRLCDTLELNLCKGDGPEECWSYPLNAAEQEVLLRKMEDYCQQQTGMSLHEYARQLRESGSQTPEMQM